MSDNEEVREKIIKAAMHVFSQHGFFKPPVRLIAEEAEVSKGLIFWYFRSKEELILEVAVRSLPTDIMEQCLKEGIGGGELLRCIGKRYLDKYKDPVLKNLLLHTLSAEALYPSIRAEITKLCGEGLRKTAIMAFGSDDPTHIMVVRSFFGGLLCYVLRPPQDISPEDYLESLMEISLYYPSSSSSSEKERSSK
ncbi:MAG: TetR/AcrR family transcriptional regulator [Caldisphaeraceae archaeon]|nr:TetR/AcrR family transcriptional regulator [Caldisphaeraceae archaeon]